MLSCSRWLDKHRGQGLLEVELVASDEWVDGRDTSLFSRSSAFLLSRTSLNRFDSVATSKHSRLQRSKTASMSHAHLSQRKLNRRSMSQSSEQLPKLPSEASAASNKASLARIQSNRKSVAASETGVKSGNGSQQTTASSQDTMPRNPSMPRVTSRSVLQRIDSASKREPSLVFQKQSRMHASLSRTSRPSLARIPSQKSTDAIANSDTANRARASNFERFGGVVGQLTGDVIGSLNNKQLDEVVTKLGHELLCYFTPQDNIDEYFRLPEIAA